MKHHQLLSSETENLKITRYIIVKFYNTLLIKTMLIKTIRRTFDQNGNKIITFESPLVVMTYWSRGPRIDSRLSRDFFRIEKYYTIYTNLLYLWLCSLPNFSSVFFGGGLSILLTKDLGRPYDFVYTYMWSKETSFAIGSL